MKNYIGHRNGMIVFSTQSPAYYEFAAPDDMTVIEVDADTYAMVSPTVGRLKFRVADDDFVQIPEQPSELHTWDWPTHAWIQDRALAEKSVRAKRDGLLRAVVDTINAVRWAAMSDAEKSAWDTYRTALLDITGQAGFPFDVEWPISPNNNQGASA